MFLLRRLLGLVAPPHPLTPVPPISSRDEAPAGWAQRLTRILQPGARLRGQHPVLGYFRQSQGGRCLRCRIAFAAADEAEAITHFERHHRWICVYLAPEGESAHGDLYQFAYAERPRQGTTEIPGAEGDGGCNG